MMGLSPSRVRAQSREVGIRMFDRSRLRIVVALVFAMSALGIVAGPATAETVTQACQGTCGYWEVYDSMAPERGANCVYAASSPYKLKQITIRPALMHGAYSNKTKVGWRFRVQRMSNNGGAWNNFYTSSYQKAKANDSIPAYAGQGFARRTWNAPANPNGYRYRIALDLQWWHNGSVEGTLKLYYDWYKAIRGNSNSINPDYCLQSY